ncbi:GNAT family N-acetyltransferase [Myxococcota bacterium]|nr:GNAT family N-acetyltransferase [Myxococcota bacterium]MBU1381111.1 GNAT family N-acetyltransferase [Myxococcota bacterium]MBU1496532.1 GNAT family N-acetyltransferase [Myxococcota bacterium]
MKSYNFCYGIKDSDEVEAIADITEKTGFFSGEEVAIARELAEESLKNQNAGDYFFIKALGNDGKIIGYTCHGRIPGSIHSWDLYWIVISPESQGSGTGRALINHAHSLIKTQEGKKVYAETSSRSQYKPTRSFYLSCGYSQAAFLDDFYGPEDSKVIYVFEL